MQSRSASLQVKFYYMNGETETFNIYQDADTQLVQQDIQQEFRRFLDKDWWVLHLSDQTICVNAASILKIEITPPITRIQGEGVFSHAELVAALK